jgi:hypothetical protein
MGKQRQTLQKCLSKIYCKNRILQKTIFAAIIRKHPIFAVPILRKLPFCQIQEDEDAKIANYFSML